MFQVEVVCTPYDGEFGGIPAGCQCDLQNNIWIADMRLGILKMDPTGTYKQVSCKPLPITPFALYLAVKGQVTGLFSHTLMTIGSTRNKVSGLIIINCKNLFHN